MADSLDVGQLIPVYRQDFISVCAYSAAIALLLYDFGLTFDREVQYIWRSKLSLPSLLFYTIRYSTILNAVPEIMELTHSGLSLTSILLLSGVAMFSATRVYAIYARNKAIYLLVLILGLVNPAINIYLYSQSGPYFFVPGPGLEFCGSSQPDSDSSWAMGARGATIAADVLVLVLTWAKVADNRKETGRIRAEAPVAAVFLSNGTAYFAILLILNVLGIAIGQDINYVYVMFTWVNILTAILTCRFMLDLREAATVTDPTGLSQLHTIVFQMPVPTTVDSITGMDPEEYVAMDRPLPDIEAGSICEEARAADTGTCSDSDVAPFRNEEAQFR